MSEKHTPGPWKAVQALYGPIDIFDANDHDIVTLYGARVSETKAANARLIAAAPDLLAELQNIANAKPKDWDPEVRDQFMEWAQSRARAAIAKATGA